MKHSTALSTSLTSNTSFSTPFSVNMTSTSLSSSSSVAAQSSRLISAIQIDPPLPDSTSSSESELDVDFLCPICEQPRKDDRWCQYCESQRLSENFMDWTSGNANLDEFIRDTQRKANSKMDYLVWIDYEMFEDVEFLAQGGFGDVYYAVWINGPDKSLVYDKEDHTWKIIARTPVALKCLHDSENIKADFLNELKAHYKCRNGLVLRCYGITQHRETRNYMLVMQYANGGDLRHYLCENSSLLTWGQKLRMLHDIALGLEGVHDMSLIHRDFHSGNLLQHTSKDGNVRTFVTDLGLCRPVNKFLVSEENDTLYGVLSYIAPELLRRRTGYAKASDVYSFGIIMWEILTCKPPFNDFAHDVHLALNICLGLRPSKVKGVPIWYVELMERCWNNDPNERPNMMQVRLMLRKQVKCLTDEEANVVGFPPNIERNNGNGEGFFKNSVTGKRTHPKAVYTSRLLPIINTSRKIDFVRGISRIIPEMSQLTCSTSDMPTKEDKERKNEDLDYVTLAFQASLNFDKSIFDNNSN